MEAIFQDPTFQEQPLEVKKKVINNYFQKEIASDPSFQEQPEEIKQKVYQNFLKENLGETAPEIDKDKVIIDTAKSDENIKQLVINKAETSVLDQMGTKITRPFNEEEQKQVDEFWGKIQMTPEKEQQYKEQLQSPEKLAEAAQEHLNPEDPDEIKALAERYTFEYSQLADMAKAYWQQVAEGKIDPELEAKLSKQRERTLQAMTEAFARKGYTLKLVEEGDKSYFVAEKDGKEYKIDQNFIKSIIDGMKASKYEITSATGGAIAGAKIGARFGPYGTIAGALIGSAIGAGIGAAADYARGAETVGKETTPSELARQGTQAATADLIFGILTMGAGKAIKTAVKPFKIIGKKIYLAYEKPAYQQLLKDTGITDDIAEKYFNEFISYYNINPKKLSQTEKLKLKMLAVALKSPKHKKDILSAIASNTDASLIVSDDINIRAQKLMDFLKKGYTPTEVKQAIKAQKAQVMKKYADMEHTLKEALKNQPVKIEQLQIDDILNRAYMTAGDDTIKQKFKGLKAQIKDLFDRNGYNAATLMEVRKQINDFYSKNYKAIDYAPTKQAIRGLKDQIDNLLDQAIEKTGIPELKQMKDKVIKEYAKVSKAEGTTLYKKLFKQGVSSDEANRALAKGLMAEDDDAIKFLNALPPADREKTELGAINAIVKDNRIIIGGKHEAQAIDWDKLSHQLEKIQKNVKSPAAKKTIKVINKMSEMFNKDPEMQSIASAIAAKIPDTIAQRLWGKITQSFNKLRFELMLRWFPSSLIPDTKLLDLYKAKSYVRRLRYIDLISSAMEKPKSFKGFVLELTKFPDKKISNQAKELLSLIKMAEKAKLKEEAKRVEKINTKFNTAFQKETEISIPDDIKVAHYEGLAKQAGYRPEDIINDELSRPTNAKGVRNAVKRYLKGNPTERDKEIIDAIIRAVDGSGIWTHPATIGALYGFEQDENGNWQYNPVKGVMGAFGASLAKKALTDKQMMNAIKMFAKKEGAKLHDKLLKSPFSPVKFAVEAGTKTREPFYLKSVKVLNKVANQKMTREQFINYLKKNGVKDEEIEWVIKPLIKGKTKIAISDILENAKPPKIELKKLERPRYDQYQTGISGNYEEKIAKFKGKGDYTGGHFGNNVLYHIRVKKQTNPENNIKAFKEYLERVSKNPEKYLKLPKKGETRRLAEIKVGKIIEALKNAKTIEDIEKIYEGYYNYINYIKGLPDRIELLEKGLDVRFYDVFDKYWDKKVAFEGKYKIRYDEDLDLSKLPAEAKREYEEITRLRKEAEKLVDKPIKKNKNIIIEEIQSDWHKEGAKYGYKKPRVNAKKAISYAFTNILPDKQKRILREILKDKKKEIKLIKKIETKLCKAIGGDKNKARRKLFDALYARNFKELGISDKYKDDFNTMLAINDFENVELNWHTPSVKVVFKRYPKGEKFVKSGGFDKLIDVLNIKKEKVPNAPFKKTWHEKALKDILEEAAQSDADAIYWTSGKVQSERYNLKTYLDKLKVKKTDKGIVIDAIDKEGKEHIINVAEDKELSDYLGKDMAEKVKEGLKTQKEVIFEGEQLSMNPKGFFDLYDKKIPQFLKKYLKKYKVEPKRVKFWGYEMWKLPLTKELKKDIIEKGQPFFIVPIILTGAAIKENE